MSTASSSNFLNLLAYVSYLKESETCDDEVDAKVKGLNIPEEDTSFSDLGNDDKQTEIQESEESPNSCISIEDKHSEDQLKTCDQKEEENGPKSEWKCFFCFETFPTKFQLDIHISKPHTRKEKPFPCNKCREGFTRQENLDIHKQSVHERPRPFICENCGKPFRTKKYLIQHSVVHSKIRNFPCPHCDKRFNQRGSCDQHMRSVHLGERHHCAICGKSFDRKGNLKKHIKTHDSNKPLDLSSKEGDGEKLVRCSSHIFMAPKV